MTSGPATGGGELPPRDNPVGSVWHRWDPHIHTPGTVLSDHFGGEGSWEEYLTRIERANPPIRALGVTDYLGLDLYEKICGYKKRGRLQGVDLIFPNVEMRYSVSAGKGSAINAHLLFSPEDDNHLELARGLLAKLTFGVKESYSCTDVDLIRLGRGGSQKPLSDSAARREGIKQFKVDPKHLFAVLHENEWARNNVLVAISVNSKDGTSQLQFDDSFTATRRQLEQEAHIIFSAQPAEREFWLGRGKIPLDKLREKLGGPKPCLHGSDAHRLVDVGKPAKDRYCWIKGDLTFESLRQTCLEPEGRAYIGREPPLGASRSRVISRIAVSGAAWLANPQISLNPGLVAIIGPRGSGKTALAEMIAAGTGSLSGPQGEKSFAKRASKYLSEASVEVTWMDGRKGRSGFRPSEDESEVPEIQYLSQQFVDKLCATDRLADALVEEIRSVIFQEHRIEDRLEAGDFQELHSARILHVRNARNRVEEELGHLSNLIVSARARKDRLTKLKKDYENKRRELRKDKRDYAVLTRSRTRANTQYLQELGAAGDSVARAIAQARRKEQALLGLKSEVKTFRVIQRKKWLTRNMGEYKDADLSSKQWEKFQIEFRGDVDAEIAAEIKKTKVALFNLRGPRANEPDADFGPDSSPRFIVSGTNLAEQSLFLLKKEYEHTKSLAGIDQANAQRIVKCSQSIVRREEKMAKVAQEIEEARSAAVDLRKFGKMYMDSYRAMIKTIIQEQQVLEELYSPLRKKLRSKSGTIGKFSFAVYREADIKKWADTGEALLDLRTKGPLRGEGTLHKAAVSLLRSVWETGDADQIFFAMAKFREDYGGKIIQHCPVRRTDPDAYAEWRRKMDSWFYDVSHISVRYDICYDGIAVRQLSPGTRGIALLLLYLGLDQMDSRPLVIDQPDENLDPRSIHQDLVPLFREVKARRQIIIVTHNANLVVNADADQVITAACGQHSPGSIPPIQYDSGSLENPRIREQVCEILEGGEEALRERALRLQVKLKGVS